MNRIKYKRGSGKVETSVDTNTGEALSVVTEKFYDVEVSLYARLFKDSLWGLADELSGNDFRVLHYLIGQTKDSTNIVTLVYGNYKSLEGGLFRGSNISSFRRSVRRLIDCGLIKRIQQNVYIVNPDISHTGKISDRNEALLEWQSIGVGVSMFEGDRIDYERLQGE